MSTSGLIINGWPVGRVAQGCLAADNEPKALRAISAAGELVFAATGSEENAASLVESLTDMWRSGGFTLDEFVDEIVYAGGAALIDG